MRRVLAASRRVRVAVWLLPRALRDQRHCTTLTGGASCSHAYVTSFRHSAVSASLVSGVLVRAPPRAWSRCAIESHRTRGHRRCTAPARRDGGPSAMVTPRGRAARSRPPRARPLESGRSGGVPVGAGRPVSVIAGIRSRLQRP